MKVQESNKPPTTCGHQPHFASGLCRRCYNRPYTPGRTYNSWSNMIQRCTNPKNTRWDSYGGRGIAVCERWRIFANFLADMGERPSKTTLDRWPNYDGNYEPSNCRWATASEQMRNRSPRRLLPRLRCTIPGCTNLHSARGMCDKHYSTWNRERHVTIKETQA